MEASAVNSVLVPVSPRRRRKDRFARWALGVAAIVALVPLLLVLYYLIHKGVGALSGSFFTTDPSGAFLGDPGGVRSAILGTVEIVGIASLISIPAGLGIAVYLVEYGKTGRIASVVRFFTDVMTGVPSIMFGLFIYITLVVTKVGGASFAAWKASIALALLMPLLLALTIASGTTLGVNGPMNALPLTIFQDLKQPRPELVQVAWGAALTLVLMVLVLSLIARLIQRRSSL
jgi:ABC-type phosphate transport system permease subunit